MATYELWVNDDGMGDTLVEVSLDSPKPRPEVPSGSKLVAVFEADTWERACDERDRRLGWYDEPDPSEQPGTEGER